MADIFPYKRKQPRERFIGDIMKMFTAKEEKNLSYALAKSADQETMLFIEELHGLLFGLAVTPEPVLPSEWLPMIFNEEPRFDDEKDAAACIGYLMEAYNRLIDDSNKGKLKFPFNIKKLSDLEYSLIEGWAYGLFIALTLRPHIWGISDEYEEMDVEDIPDDIIDLIEACSIITAIAMPDEMDEMIKADLGTESNDPEKLEAALYGMLPTCVQTLQNHCEKVRTENATGVNSMKMPAGIKKAQSGRNDLCPCGSGKKYKKCCGNN